VNVRDLADGFELDARGIRHERQHLVFVEYKGIVVGEYRLDFLIEGALVVELAIDRDRGPVACGPRTRFCEAEPLALGLLA